MEKRGVVDEHTPDTENCLSKSAGMAPQDKAELLDKDATKTLSQVVEDTLKHL
jgi:hypothetical protein